MSKFRGRVQLRFLFSVFSFFQGIVSWVGCCFSNRCFLDGMGKGEFGFF
jgi:hypothetical protein